MGESLLEGLGRRLADEARRVEVGLADLQVHDLLARGFERARACQNFECGFGPETAHALRECHRSSTKG